MVCKCVVDNQTLQLPFELFSYFQYKKHLYFICLRKKEESDPVYLFVGHKNSKTSLLQMENISVFWL